jgi:beta-lactamase regulating signal transducer with metallopeptidase domain
MLLVLLLRGQVARIFGPSVAYWLWLLPAARLFMPSLTKEVAATDAFPVSEIVRDAALAAPAQAASAEPAIMAATSIDWTGIGLIVWLGGASLLFIVQMLRYVSLRDELLLDANEIDCIGDIRVVESDRIGGPLAFGLFRRYIAVPDHFTYTFNADERDLALAHELAHHRSGDLFANLAAFIVLCLMWFNPLAWMAWNAFRFDQEAACDARVLAGADAGTRHSYGRALARAASSDRMPTLAMAMAFNNPRSIIERLRRLMMKDTSKGRLLAGRAAIFAAAALALPLTATVVPVFAEDKPKDAATVTKSKTKVIVIEGKDGKTRKIDVSGDAETPFVKTIEKDGKTIILRSNRELSEADIEKMVANAEEARAEAEAAADNAEEARAVAEEGRTNAEAGRKEAIRIISSMDFSNFIPEIDIREMHRNCKEGESISTDVSGFNGQSKSRVRVVMCGKGQARMARLQAMEGLREARAEIEGNADIPESIRKSVLDSLKKQIDRMQDQLTQEAEADDEA